MAYIRWLAPLGSRAGGRDVQQAYRNDACLPDSRKHARLYQESAPQSRRVRRITFGCKGRGRFGFYQQSVGSRRARSFIRQFETSSIRLNQESLLKRDSSAVVDVKQGELNSLQDIVDFLSNCKMFKEYLKQAQDSGRLRDGVRFMVSCVGSD